MNESDLTADQFPESLETLGAAVTASWRHGICASRLASGALCLSIISEVTHIFDRIQGGKAQAADDLLPLVYDALRRLAAAKVAREAAGLTLQATALSHKAWLRVLSENSNEADFMRLSDSSHGAGHPGLTDTLVGHFLEEG